jgi:GAF domain-containing protein
MNSPADQRYRALLQSIVDVACAIFVAAAASVFMLDEEASELVFEAVAGEGSSELVGRRFPASTGIAGSVLITRQPIILDRVADDPRFGREAAESTGFVPTNLMAVPLLSDERPLGVLEVLDRRDRSRSPLQELELLGLFADQAAVALDLTLRARAETRAAAADERVLLATIEGSLSKLDGERRLASRQLLDALAVILGRPSDDDL